MKHTPEFYFKYNLKATIVESNIRYRIGNPINISELTEDVQEFLGKKSGQLSDRDYDKLIEKLKEISPNDELFDNAIIEKTSDLSDSFDRMEKLDKPMYSLEKKKSVDEVQKWVKNKNIPVDTIVVITGKYDGVSALKNEFTKKAHSRGDGIEGQNITKHLNMFSDSKKSSFEFYTIGELIIPKQVFEENNFVRSSNGEPYKNPRNMVAGLVNHDEVSPYWEFVDHVRYGVADEEFKYDKFEHLNMIEKETGVKTPFEMLPISILTTEFLDELYYKWSEKYEIDGIVIDINDKNLRKQLGRETNNNPSYAIAYKNPEWSEKSKTNIIDIEWNISKQGYLKPVAILEPIALEGVIISRVTLNNAKFVKDNNIGIGSKVIIIRSGSVIPKIISVIKHTEFKMPVLENNEIFWNENNVELCVANTDEQKIKKIVSFFEILSTDNVSEGIINQLYNTGYKTIKDILNLTILDFQKLDKFGKRKSNIIYNSIKKSITNVNLAKLMHASGFFINLGSKKISLLIHFDEKPLFNEIINVNGFSDISATAYLNGYDNFYEWLQTVPQITIDKKYHIMNDDFKNTSFCFTGIRRKDLEDVITSKSGKITSGVSKKLTYLVCKNKNSGSSKLTKAKNLGVIILSINELEDFLT